MTLIVTLLVSGPTKTVTIFLTSTIFLEIRNVELISSRRRTHCNLLAGLVVVTGRREGALVQRRTPSLTPSVSQLF